MFTRPPPIDARQQPLLLRQPLLEPFPVELKEAAHGDRILRRQDSADLP
jgi:hypothetical protein